MNKVFLALAIGLSITSKLLQLFHHPVLGNILALPCATFFIWALLLYSHTFKALLKQQKTKKHAIKLGAGLSLGVFFFQLFAIAWFGNKNSLGFLFLPLAVVLGAFSVFKYVSLVGYNKKF